MDKKALDYHEGIRITGLLIFHIPQFLVKRRDSDLKRFASNNLFVAHTFKQQKFAFLDSFLFAYLDYIFFTCFD